MDTLTVLLFTPLKELEEKVNLSSLPGNSLVEKKGSLSEILRPGFFAKEFVELYLSTDEQLYRYNAKIPGLRRETQCAIRTNKYDTLSYFLALDEDLYVHEMRALISSNGNRYGSAFYVAHRYNEELDALVTNQEQMYELLVTRTSLTNVVDQKLIGRITSPALFSKFLTARLQFVAVNIRYVSTEGILAVFSLYQNGIPDLISLQLFLAAAAKEGYMNYLYEEILRSVEELSIEKVTYVVCAALKNGFKPHDIMDSVMHDVRGFMAQYQVLIVEAVYRLVSDMVDIDEIYEVLDRFRAIVPSVKQWYQNKKRIIDDV